MAVDFSGLSSGSAADRATEPRRIFAALTNKDQKYEYPRDVQSEVWERWHARRNEPDLVVKMNTGGGKTVVGLMMLKSCLNERSGPGAFVVPDKYLGEQVRKEANALGLETTDDPRSSRFQSGKATLVTHIHKLVNGKSVFGTSNSVSRIEIGALLIDDAHACLSVIEDQFTLTIPSKHPTYQPIAELFKRDLVSQSRPTQMDMESGTYSAVMPIPFWAWADHQAEVLNILHPHQEDDDFKFVWPLIQELLPICRVGISSQAVEIAPPCPPIQSIPSVGSAKRRIYLTATLPDDSVLVTHFGADPGHVAIPITPKTADDLGDRMILTPLDTHPGASEAEIQQLLAAEAASRNVVVIVPSNRRARAWKHLAVAVYDKDSIEAGVDALRSGHVGLVVLVNKYDGIDLPGAACEILAIDGLPESYSNLDRLEALALDNTEAFMTRQVQRIEQGMGRGVRSNRDFCVVMLLGPRLTQRLHTSGGFQRFSTAAQAQLRLSEEVADLLHEKPLSAIRDVVARCLDRDGDWVEASRSALDGVEYQSSPPSPVAIAEREAFDLAALGRTSEAADCLASVVHSIDEPRQRGWIKAQSAAYRHLGDPVQAQRTLASAREDNPRVAKPSITSAYKRIGRHSDQAKRCAKYLRETYPTPGDLTIGFATILSDLIPDPDNTGRFEQAVKDLGEHLGFEVQRPEQEIGDGPDILWLLGELEFLVVECKSGVITESISRHDAAQLSHSLDWFIGNYDQSCKAVPLMIHKVNKMHEKATPRQGTRVVTFAKLAALCEASRKFAEAAGSSGRYDEPDEILARLREFRLDAPSIISSWTLPPRA